MFGGTGTVAVVSRKTGRNFIHVDVSEEYCKTAEMRLNGFRHRKSRRAAAVSR